MNYKVAFLSFIFLLTGCASIPNEEYVQLSTDVSFKLSSPPVDLIGDIQTHLIDVQFNKESQSFIAQVEYAKNTITIAAMSVSGVPLFDLIWHTNKPSKITQYIPLPGIDLNYLIADLQWVNWPLMQLKKAVISKDTIVVQTDISISDWQRKLLFKDKLIMQVVKKDKQYFLHHKQRDYQITITDLGEE